MTDDAYKSHDLEHRANLDEARERAKTDVFFRHAYEMVQYGNYTWDQALVSICLALADARNATIKDFQKHLEECVQPPIVVLRTQEGKASQ